MASLSAGYAVSWGNGPETTSVDCPWDLLLLTASPTATRQGALAPQVDWQAVLRLADHHGTSYLLHEALSSISANVPSDILASLRAGYQINVQRSLLLARELFRVLDCLAGQGIEAVPYKGVVLSEVYYGDIAVRRAGDNDVFIRKGDVLRAKDAVRALGYIPREPIPAAAEPDYLHHGYEWTFDAPAGKNLLELQWALEPRFYSVNYDMEGLFARAVKVGVAGRDLKTPSAEDLVVVLSIHAAKHAWERLIWLCDIARLVRRQTLNWEWIQEQARQLGVSRILHITLLLLKNLLGTEIPVELERELEGDRAARQFAQRFAGELAVGTPQPELSVAYFRLMMELRERPLDRWKFLTRLTFTPGPGEWEAIRLPPAAFPFYRMVRVARLAAKVVRA